MKHYLYCARFAFGGVALAKIGTSHKPHSRIMLFAQNNPFPLGRVSLKGFPSRDEADAWEKLIIAAATRYREGSEWVVDNDILDSLWSTVKGGEDVPYEAAYTGRKPTGSFSENRADAFVARFRGRVGKATAAKVKYAGNPAIYNRAVIQARLIQGFGVDDIARLDDIPPAEIRAEISRLREAGELGSIYRMQRGAA